MICHHITSYENVLTTQEFCCVDCLSGRWLLADAPATRPFKAGCNSSKKKAGCNTNATVTHRSRARSAPPLVFFRLARCRWLEGWLATRESRKTGSWKNFWAANECWTILPPSLNHGRGSYFVLSGNHYRSQ
jgi:hypothetical protein